MFAGEMGLARALQDKDTRRLVSADAIAEAEKAVRERSGIRGVSAQFGLETINRLRPGFLERHIHAMLPDMARAVEPHWEDGIATGDPCGYLKSHAVGVTAALLQVADAYVEQASDTTAIAVYQQLRPRADRRIAEQMPRIAGFIQRHSPS